MTNAAVHPWVKARTICRELSPILVELAEQNEGDWVAIVMPNGWSFVTREAYYRMMVANTDADAITKAVNLRPQTVQRVIDQLLNSASPKPQTRAAG